MISPAHPMPPHPQASERFSHLKEHASFLDAKAGGSKRWGGLVGSFVKPSGPSASPLNTIDDDSELSREEFKSMLGKIDAGLRALPATAQVGGRDSESRGIKGLGDGVGVCAGSCPKKEVRAVLGKVEAGLGALPATA